MSFDQPIGTNGKGQQSYDTGAVRDNASGKGRFDLLPVDALFEVAKHFEKGAQRYADRNWEKGIPLSRFLDSAIRHTLQHLNGKRDEPHLIAGAWNLLCAIQTLIWIEQGVLPGSLDDLPARGRLPALSVSDLERLIAKDESPVRTDPVPQARKPLLEDGVYVDCSNPRNFSVVKNGRMIVCFTADNSPSHQLHVGPDELTDGGDIEDLYNAVQEGRARREGPGSVPVPAAEPVEQGISVTANSSKEGLTDPLGDTNPEQPKTNKPRPGENCTCLSCCRDREDRVHARFVQRKGCETNPNLVCIEFMLPENDGEKSRGFFVFRSREEILSGYGYADYNISVDYKRIK